MVAKRMAILATVAAFGLLCGCASLTCRPLFGRRAVLAPECECTDLTMMDGPILGQAGPVVVSPGDAAVVPNGNGQATTNAPPVAPPPKLVPLPQTSQVTPYVPSKNSR